MILMYRALEILFCQVVVMVKVLCIADVAAVNVMVLSSWWGGGRDYGLDFTNV